MKIRYAVLGSPVGWVLVAATGRGLCAVEFGDSPKTLEQALHKQYPTVHLQRDERVLRPVLQQVEAYFDGRRSRFDLPVDVPATKFQKRVWQRLQKIPYGQTCSYSEIARAIGQPKAARAVARACAANPVALVIPCHRVIRRDGSLGGYGGGIERKRALLAHEGVLLQERL